MFQKLLNLFRKKPKAEEALIRSQQFNRSQPKKPAGVSIPVPPKRPEVRMAPEPARRSEPARDPVPDVFYAAVDSYPSERSYGGCSGSSDSSSSCSSSSSGD